MKEYKFSEIKRYENFSYNRVYNLVGKYGCQIFDEKGNYIGSLVADSYKEVVELQKHYLSEVIK